MSCRYPLYRLLIKVEFPVGVVKYTRNMAEAHANGEVVEIRNGPMVEAQGVAKDDISVILNGHEPNGKCGCTVIWDVPDGIKQEWLADRPGEDYCRLVEGITEKLTAITMRRSGYNVPPDIWEPQPYKVHWSGKDNHDVTNVFVEFHNYKGERGHLHFFVKVGYRYDGTNVYGSVQVCRYCGYFGELTGLKVRSYFKGDEGVPGRVARKVKAFHRNT